VLVDDMQVVKCMLLAMQHGVLITTSVQLLLQALYQNWSLVSTLLFLYRSSYLLAHRVCYFTLFNRFTF